MAEKTIPIPETLFNTMAQYRAQQIEMENTNRLLGEKLGEWLEGKLGEDKTLGQFQKDEQDLFIRIDRAKADLKNAYNSMVGAIRRYSFNRT